MEENCINAIIKVNLATAQVAITLIKLGKLHHLKFSLSIFKGKQIFLHTSNMKIDVILIDIRILLISFSFEIAFWNKPGPIERGSLLSLIEDKVTTDF